MKTGAKITLSIVGLYLISFYGREKLLNLKHFKAYEFGAWFPVIDKKLLNLLDNLREEFGHPIIVSPASGAIGRDYGTGYHNVAKHGKVMALDIMPVKQDLNGYRSLNESELRAFFDLAKSMGFGGVGVYPDWLPYAGFHIDTREKVNGYVATWGAVKSGGTQEYVSAEYALNK